MISQRTKDGLAIARAKRKRLSNHVVKATGTLAETTSDAAATRDAAARATLETMVDMPSRAIARRLTEMGIEAPRGVASSYQTVLRVMSRLELKA